MKKGLIFIIFLTILLFGIAKSQENGKPFIRNYLAKEYAAHVQNWSVIQDQRGVMYFGNSDGLLEYDGVSWRLIPIPTNGAVRSLAMDSKFRIYVGGVNDIGYIVPDSKKEIKYISLTDKISPDDRKFYDVWETFIINDEVFFRCDYYIFRYSKEKITTWYSKTKYGKSFVSNGKFFVSIPDQGLLYLENNTFIPAPNSEYFKTHIFKFAYPIALDTMILGINDIGLAYYIPNKKPTETIQKFKSPAGEIYKKYNMYANMQQIDNMLYLGTSGGGCAVIDKRGNLLQEINQSNGLNINRVHYLFVDSQKSLWLATNNGISHVDVKSAISYWDKNDGLLGATESIIRYNGRLYISTHQGFFYIENNKIKKIEGIESSCWTFLVYKEPEDSLKTHLLAGTYNGLYEIIGSKIFQLIKTNESIFELYRSKFNKNRILCGLANGVYSIQFKNGTFKIEDKIENISDDVRSLYEENDHTLWLGTFRNGAIRLTFGKTLFKPTIKYYQSKQGLASNINVLIFPYKNRMLFGCEKGLFCYNKETDRMEPDFTFGIQFCNGDKDVFTFIPASDGKIWITGLNNKSSEIGYLEPNEKHKFNWIYKPFKQIPEMLVLAFYVEPDGTAWIGGSEGLFKYNPHQQFNPNVKFNTLIRKVKINNDSLIFNGTYPLDSNHFTFTQPDGFRQQIAYKHNSLTFNFSACSFTNEQENYYHFYLEGSDKNWSSWQKLPMKEYTNLAEGDYIFHLKAKNIFGNEGDEATYSFTILPPWYRTLWAFFIDIILFIGFVWFIVRLNTKRLIATNIELERVVFERTTDLLESNALLEEHQAELEIRQEEITAQAELLAKTNLELEKLSVVASETDNAVMIMDADTNFEWVNEGFVRMYKCNLDDLINEKGKSLLSTNQKEDIKTIIQDCIKNKKTVNYQIYNTLKTGESFWVQTTLTPITNSDGEIMKFIAIDSDITKLKKAEQEIINQNEELEKHRTNLEGIVQERTIELEIAKNKAEESDRLKSAFLANMSHEIRTPMNAIIGFSSLLTDNNLEESEKEELVQYIQSNGNSLLHLIDDIIDLSKIEAGQVSISITPFNLNKQLYELFDIFNHRKNTIYKSTVDLKLLLGVDSTEFTIHGDAIRIKQLLSNLVDNALKFTDKGSIEFGYTLENNEKIKFFVRDSGIGMSESQQKQIFNRFTKIEEDKTKLYRGAGLGLTICKNIANLMGGDIFVESKVNNGTTFYFTIPLIKGSERPDNANFKDLNKLDYNWSGKTLLIAEDEEGNYQYLDKLLRRTKVNLLRATNGQEAFDIFRNSNIDLILMDIKMPIMDGVEATKLIRKENKTIPIIALSAYAFNQEIEAIKKEGFNEYLVKPTNHSKLLSLLDEYLNHTVA